MINTKIIKALNPCKDRFDNWKKFYGSKQLTYAQFLGLKNITQIDKMWVAFRVMDKDLVRFCTADIAELVLPIFEAKYPNDNRPRLAIEAARAVPLDRGKARAAADAAYAASYAAYAASDAAAYASYAAASATAIASYAAYAASDAAYAASDAAYASYAAYAASAASAAAYGASFAANSASFAYAANSASFASDAASDAASASASAASIQKRIRTIVLNYLI